MTTPSIVIAITAAALLGAASCQGAQVKDEAEDVKDAREDVQDAKQDVKEEQEDVKEQEIEFSADLKQRVADAEERYKKLELRSEQATAGAAGTAAASELDAAKQRAKTEMEDVRNATPTNVEQELDQLDEAMEAYEDTLDKYDDDAGDGAM
jgi:exonuclease VII large subunit